jgi:hypothetical protein
MRSYLLPELVNFIEADRLVRTVTISVCLVAFRESAFVADRNRCSCWIEKREVDPAGEKKKRLRYAETFVR